MTTKQMTAALFVALIVTPALAEKTKGQICEEHALREAFPIALRDCHGPLTKKCKRLVDQWLAAVPAAKRKCVDEPRGDLWPGTYSDALEYCRSPDVDPYYAMVLNEG